MSEEKSHYWRFFAGFTALILIGVAIFVVAIFIYEKSREAAQTAPVQNAIQPKPDEIAITKLPNGDQLVENKTEGYSVSVDNNLTVQKPTSPSDKGINILTTSEIGCSIYFNKIENKNLLSPIEYFKNSYGDIIDAYSMATGTIKNIPATTINVNSGGENGYSKIIYLPTGSVIYSIVGYSNKPLTAKCNERILAIIQSAEF